MARFSTATAVLINLVCIHVMAKNDDAHVAHLRKFDGLLEKVALTLALQVCAALAILDHFHGTGLRLSICL